MANVWAPLVPARVDNGGMWFILGTHQLSAVPHERRDYYLEIRENVLAPRLAQATMESFFVGTRYVGLTK